MVEFFTDYGLFLLKVITLVIAIIIVIVAIVAAAMRGKKDSSSGGQVKIIRLNDQYDDMRDVLSTALLDDSAMKYSDKDKKAEDKAKRKAEKKAAKEASKKRGKGDQTLIDEPTRKRVFVVDFDGDVRASAVENLRREVSAILTTATPQDEVVVRLESGGGMVAPYGLGASQLARVLDKNVPLTVTVDTVAASGGYMMACVSNKILAAPFAMVGSIGVVAQMPNFHRLLKKYDVDVELLTAGKYKRTLTMLGENTEEGRKKFIEDIERIHASFKNHVQSYRRKLDIEKVATGEVWLGQEALALDLVDSVSTSDEYLMKACDSSDVLIVRYKEKKPLGERFSISFASSIDALVMRWVDRLIKSRFGV